MGIISKLFGIDSLVKKSMPAKSYAWVGGFPIYNSSDTIHNINYGYAGSEDITRLNQF
jgi:hypothetical protein